MERFKISVIIPVYNVAPYIERCLESVLEQEYVDLEIILVDDCGDDNSMELAKNFCSTHSGNFVLLKHDKNRGLSAARNTGVRQATGDYLFFLDSDDELPKDAMKLFVDYLRKYGIADFLIGNYIVKGNFDSVPLFTPPVLEKAEIMHSYINGNWYAMACGKLINRRFFIENNLWFITGRLHEDELFSFQLALAATKMITLREPVYKYIIRKNSITTMKQEKNYTDSFWIIFKKIELANLSSSCSSFPMSRYYISMLFQYAVSVSGSHLPYLKKKILLKWAKKKILSIGWERMHLKSLVQFMILLFPIFVTMGFCKLVYFSRSIRK